MLALAWVLSLVSVGYLGYHYSKIISRLHTYQADLEEWRKDRQERKKQTELKSVIVDPEDIAYQVRMEEQRKIRELNSDL